MFQYKYAFSADELFMGLDNKLLTGQWVKNRYKDPKVLAAKIFKDCFYEILLDIIENNVTFVLPLKFGNYAEICMQQFADEDFKKLYKRGKFRKIDFVLSQFTGNQLFYKYKTKKVGVKSKPIYVNKDLKERIEKYTNEARQYY